MKRVMLALGQIAIVIWAGYTVYQHDLHNISALSPFIAAIILRGWLSDRIDDPLFGKSSAQKWLLAKLKRLLPKQQPSKWDV